MSMQDEFRDELPQKQGMSTTAKVLLVLGSIAGVFLLACCGGGIYVYYKAKDVIQNIAESVSSDPEVVKARTAEIIHIDVPENFAPMNTGGAFGNKMVMYGNQAKGSMLMIMEMNLPAAGPPGEAGAKQRREEMLRAMRQQQAQQAGGLNGDVNEQGLETREFTIGGQKVPFDFIKGTAPGNGVAVRRVVGVFEGRHGTVMLNLTQQESDYREEEIVRMIESIRLPDEDADGEDAEKSIDQPAGDATPDANDKAGAAEASSESSP